MRMSAFVLALLTWLLPVQAEGVSCSALEESDQISVELVKQISEVASLDGVEIIFHRCDENSVFTVVSYLTYPTMGLVYGANQILSGSNESLTEILIFYRSGEQVAISKKYLINISGEGRVEALGTLNESAIIFDLRPKEEQGNPLFLTPRPLSQ